MLNKTISNKNDESNQESEENDQDESKEINPNDHILEPMQRMSSQGVAEAIAKCENMEAKVQEEVVKGLEMNLDLKSFDDESEWTVEITEEANKWFKKHKKKQNDLCQRVISRMKILSTGRWPYCLCKPLKTKKSSTKLYESKIDSGSRIIWEVAVSFSPRLSQTGCFLAEQVIRVWDIVDDHDKLSDRISLAIDRIEKSQLRGEESTVSFALEGGQSANASDIDNQQLNITVPKKFFMKQDEAFVSKWNGLQQEKAEESKQAIEKYCPPASHDQSQYNLLKFYQLNSDAIDILMDKNGNDTEIDLPFSPGPKEHEIIQYRSGKSILLMGRR